MKDLQAPSAEMTELTADLEAESERNKIAQAAADRRTAGADALGYSDQAAGEIAAAQGWKCTGCGTELGGGAGVLALAKCEIPDGQLSMIVPTIIHADCIDDARMVDTLADVPGIAPPQTRADADAARKARIGALNHAIRTALETLQAAHATGIEAQAAPPDETAGAVAGDGNDDDLPDLS